MCENIQFLKSQRGGLKLVFQGYVYNKSHKYKNYSYWRCEKQENGKSVCEGKVIFGEGCGLEIRQQHNHSPDPTRVELLSLREQMREAAMHSTEIPSNIIQEAMKAASQSANAQISEEVTKRALRHLRQKKRNYPSNAKTRQDIVIPDYMQKTLAEGGRKEEMFLLHDSHDEDRILIFSSQSNLERLADCELWIADGTFKVSPKLYTQLYTISGNINGVIVPLVFALLPNKQQATYVKFLNALFYASSFMLAPKQIIIDYEKAVMNAVQIVWPSSKVYGCLFHLGQALYRKIQDLGLASQYNDHTNNISLEVRSIIALAFVPPLDVRQRFLELIMTMSSVLKPFLKYVEKTWIGTWDKDPLFPIAMWNVYDRVLDGIPRTTNSAEGYHHSLNCRFRTSHPTLYSFIEKLRNEEHKWHQLRGRVDAGKWKKPTKKNASINKDIRKTVLTYNTISIKRYCEAIAHILHSTQKRIVDQMEIDSGTIDKET